MLLVIAEKPSVARDLARVLGVRAGGGTGCFAGDRYTITWCIGHLVELEEPAAYDAQWKAWRLDRLPMIPRAFQLRPARHATAQLRVVRELLRDRARFTGVINACDAGREGELIFRYVYQHANARLPVQRLWVSSLTDEAIARGFAQLRAGVAFEPLADAARSRSEADWLVGMNATRAITVRARDGGGDALYSIGRVQTPTLAMLVEREREIRAFVPVAYWEVRARCGEIVAWWRAAKAPAAAKPELVGRFATVALAEAVVTRDRAVGAVVVEKVEAKTTREPPPMLFDLTSLQRTANRRFGLSAARTLEIAQALYERHKIVTYPRTDSRHLSADLVGELPALVAALGDREAYAAFVAPLVAGGLPRLSRRVVDDTKVSDHHAIIPTPAAGRARALDRDEARVFDLIARRFLGVFYPDAEFAITDAWLRAGEGASAPPAFAPVDREAAIATIEALPAPPDRFHARGRVRTIAGWQEVAGIAADARGEGGGAGDTEALAVLPPLAVGQRLAAGFDSVAKETAPPPRFTEATLLGAMEFAGRRITSPAGVRIGGGDVIDDEALRAAMRDAGLGTPATRAAIIETLLARTYIARDRQALVPTPTGEALIAAIPVPSLASPELTGAWEARLAAIARGTDTRAAFMADIARFVTEIVDAIRAAPPPVTLPGAPPPPARFGRGGSSKSKSWPAKSARGRGGAARTGASRAATPRNDRPRRTDHRRSTTDTHTSPAPPNDWWQLAKAAMGAPAIAGDVDPPRDADPGHARAPVARARAPKLPAGEPRTPKAPPAPGSPTKLACPTCRAGTVIAGNRGWGCSRWREGCAFVTPFTAAATPAKLKKLVAPAPAKRAVKTSRPGNRRSR